MQYLVLEDLARCAANQPEHIAVIDQSQTWSYQQLAQYVKRVGSALIPRIAPRTPVAVYMEKSAEVVGIFLGIVSAGGCYSLFNPDLPHARLQSMEQVLQPAYIVTDSSHFPDAVTLFGAEHVLLIDTLFSAAEDPGLLANRQAGIIDTDPLYINFTSGSTGTPKGIVVSHRSVVDFITVFTQLFNINQKDVLANQAPFDFDVSVKDIYSALHVGATLLIVPRQAFSSPTFLVDYLCDNHATTLIWAVSALCLLSTFHGLEYKVPQSINKILFSGEVMPAKHLKYFRKYLPHAMYVNLYGPTEITCNCTYHILQPACDYADGLPIGIPFPNEDVFLLDEDDKKITLPEQCGEICVRGTALALGYYGAPAENEKRFVQNPLCTAYPERIYRTGDLGKYTAQGLLVFCGRTDFQIKYMGHRIELEEIERAMNAVDGVTRSCCLFDSQRERLSGVYVGTISREALHAVMKQTLPAFMIPGKLRQIDTMPLTKNGKIDRKKLEEVL